MSLDQLTAQIKEKFAFAPPINARIKFDFGDSGLIHIDATQNPPVISQDDHEADTTLICSVETFNAILAGTQDPTIAFMTGKLKVTGAMGVAMKLNAILEG